MPTATPGGSAPSSKLVTPSFTLRIPPKGSSAKRRPKFISPSSLSVKISLDIDSAGINPTTLAGNPAVTNVGGTSGIDCTTSCTIAGPPAPPGFDQFTVTMYDAPNATGNALSHGVQDYTIVSGTANNESLTLLGVVASSVIVGIPAANAYAAGAMNQTQFSVEGFDADGDRITGDFASPIVVTHSGGFGVIGSFIAGGSCNSDPGPVPFVDDNFKKLANGRESVVFCYAGLAENPATLTSSGGVSPVIFQPLLAVPAYVAGSGTPSSVVVGTNPPEIQLVATTGTGSTGSVSFQEAGWTGTPFNLIVPPLGATAGSCTSGGPLSTFATVSAASVGNATIFTVTAIASPAAGSCTVTVNDGLTANTSDGSSSFVVSYTSSALSVNGHVRKTR